MAAGGASWASAGALEDGVGNTFDLSTTVAGGSQPYWPGWWVWTAPADSVVQLDTFASVDGGSGDTILTVFTGADEGSAVVAVTNDDAELGVLLSALTFRATSGTTYHIQVGTFDSDADTITGYVLTAALNAYEDLLPVSGSEEVVAPGLGGPVYPFPTSPVVGGPGCLTDADDATYLDLVAAHEDGADPEATSGHAHLPGTSQTPIGLLWSMRAAATVSGASALHAFDSHDGEVLAADLVSGVIGGITGGADTFDDDGLLSTYATLAATVGAVPAPGVPAGSGSPVYRTEWLKMAVNPPAGEVAEAVTFRAAVVPASGWDPSGTFLTVCLASEDQSTLFYTSYGAEFPVDGTPVEVTIDDAGPGIAWIPANDPTSGGVAALCATGLCYLYVYAGGFTGDPSGAAVRIYDIAVGSLDTGNAGPAVLELDIVSKDGDGPPPEYAASFDYGVDVPLTTDGTFYDYTGDFTVPARNPGALTLDDVLAFVGSGAYVGLTPNADGGSNAGPWELEVLVSELTLTALFGEVVLTFPPLRLTNRTDQFASARSLTGNSQSRQGSNRLTGYL